MKTLIKILVAFGIAAGAVYFASKYDLVVTPVAAQENCVTIEQQTAGINELVRQINSASAVPFILKIETFDGLVSDNLLASLAGPLNVTNEDLKEALSVVETSVVYILEGLSTVFLVNFNTEGCKVGELEIPTDLYTSVVRSAQT